MVSITTNSNLKSMHAAVSGLIVYTWNTYKCMHLHGLHIEIYRFQETCHPRKFHAAYSYQIVSLPAKDLSVFKVYSIALQS